MSNGYMNDLGAKKLNALKEPGFHIMYCTEQLIQNYQENKRRQKMQEVDDIVATKVKKQVAQGVNWVKFENN